MRKLTGLFATIALLVLMSCGKSDEQMATSEKRWKDSLATTRNLRAERALAMQDDFNLQSGKSPNSGWYCPDTVRGFPAVDIQSWNKVPVVNARLPTFEEIENGTSLIYYDKFKTPDAKPYNMMLPKLATWYSPYSKKDEIIIVIQIVQTTKDTVAGFRFLTGGNGTSDFRDVHFLTDNEIKKISN